MNGAECIWEISVPSSQFCCEPKIALKIKSFKYINNDNTLQIPLLNSATTCVY